MKKTLSSGDVWEIVTALKELASRREAMAEGIEANPYPGAPRMAGDLRNGATAALSLAIEIENAEELHYTDQE